MTLQSMSMFAVSVGQKNLVQRNWMVLKRIGSVRAIPLGAVRCQCLWEKKIIQTHALYIYRRIRFAILKFCRFWSNECRKCSMFSAGFSPFHLISYYVYYVLQSQSHCDRTKWQSCSMTRKACCLFSTTSETIPRSWSRKPLRFKVI